MAELEWWKSGMLEKGNVWVESALEYLRLKKVKRVKIG